MANTTGTIDSLAFGGEGILRQEGLVIFVPFTAPGDQIDVEITTQKKRFARGKLLRILQNGPDRIAPGCPYFGNCGGCQMQHLNYTAQLEAKRRFIADALERIGKITPPPFSVTPATQQWHYRRHIRLQLAPLSQGFQAGYISCDNTTLLPIQQCPIFLPSDSSLFSSLNAFLAELSSEGIEKGTVRILKSAGEKCILAFDFSPRIPHNAHIAEKASAFQGILFRCGDHIEAFGKSQCAIEILGIQARFSPYGFVQNHPEQNEKLYQAILNAVPLQTKKILDLYCGIGLTSALFAQKHIQVTGIEAHAETIALAKSNCGDTVCFIVGKAEKEGLLQIIEEKPDLILCNPPRTGMHPDLTECLIHHPVKTLLYVSCMPSTLARDLQKLIDGGYRLEKLEAFDMFPQTTHVETLAILNHQVQ